MMNEHIEKLKQEAYVTKDGEFCFDGGKVEILDVNKFAELIVKEMCDVFDKRAEPSTGFYEPHEPAELIREHFGVEE
jgi:hypothetical protein